MILVTEAGYQGMMALSACRTLPVSASTTSSASACTACGVTTASAVARRIQFNEEARSSGRRKCTFPFRSFDARLEKGGPVDLTFGFQACPAPSLCGSANLYRLGEPEQRPATKSWTKSSQIWRCLNRDRAH